MTKFLIISDLIIIFLGIFIVYIICNRVKRKSIKEDFLLLNDDFYVDPAYKNDSVSLNIYKKKRNIQRDF